MPQTAPPRPEVRITDFDAPGTSVPSPIMPAPLAFELFGWWAQLPPIIPLPAPSADRLSRQLREWTGWSQRQLGEVLGTSHTTIRQLERGRHLVEARSGDLRRRLLDLYEVAERVYVLVDRNPTLTAAALTESHAGTSAADLVSRGQVGQAYLVAIDSLRPRLDRQLITGTPTRRPGPATVPLGE
jgi:transcriptional regulator with XRE-family HTH domain